MTSLKPIIPLLSSASLLFAGNGVMTTLIALRAKREGFDGIELGLIGALYFTGFLVAALTASKIIRQVGYIRTFVAMSAISAIMALLMINWIDPYGWMACRFVMGYALSSLFLVNESWLNDAAENADRGRVLSLYRVLDFSFVLFSQVMINFFDIESFEIFTVSAMLFCLAIVPLSLSPRSRPSSPPDVKFSLRKIYALSPLAFISCLAIGMSNSTFRTLGPNFAEGVGLSIFGATLFIAVGILGGTITQYPLGYISDRFDRRKLVLFITLAASAAAVGVSFFSGLGAVSLLIGVFLFGSMSLPLYSLAQALANDRAEQDQRLAVAAALLIAYAIGAAIGPIVGGIVIDFYGTRSLFYMIGTIHALFACVSVWRLIARPGIATEDQKPAVVLARTSAAMAQLAPVEVETEAEKESKNEA